MITTANFDLDGKLFTDYNQLFTDAWTILVKKGKLRGEKDNEDASKGKIAFSSLQHYLSYLRDLVALDPIYLMLPIDEKPFAIDTNSRTIKPPEDFSKYSEVQSDNYAEILTFSVNRYFDYQDLSLTTIGVQWINETSRKEGISIIKLIDLKTYGNEDKIRFGWPLTKDMTDTPGNLRFAVRFFTKGQNGEFEYLLNTTPISIPIKETLTYHSAISENSSDYDFFKTYIQNSSNPSYRIPTRVNFYEAPDSSAAIIVNPGEEDHDTLRLSAQAGTSDLNPITYKWYHEYAGFKQYQPRDLETGKTLEWPKIRPATPDLYIVDAEATSLNDGKTVYKKFEGEWPEETVNYLFELNPRYLIIGDENDPLYEISSSWHLYNPVDDNGQPAWPSKDTRPTFTLWLKKNNGVEEYYEPYLGEWPAEKPSGEDALYFSKTDLFFKAENAANKDVAKSVVGKYYVRGINEHCYDLAKEGYNRTCTEAPALGCEIAPPQEIVITKDVDTAKFFDDITLTNNTVNLEIAKSSDDNIAHKTFEVEQLVSTTVDGVPQFSWTPLEDEPIKITNNTVSYQIDEVGKYRVHLKSKLNRADTSTYSQECEFFNLPGDLDGVMQVNGKLVNDKSFPYLYNSIGNVVTIGGEFYDNDKGEWVGTNNLGKIYTFYIRRDLDNEKASEVGTVTYNWQYGAIDQEKLTLINKNMANENGLIQSLEEATYADYVDEDGNPFTKEAFEKKYPQFIGKLGQKLTVQVQDQDAEYQFVCKIDNSITTSAGSESTSSDAYTFCFI